MLKDVHSFQRLSSPPLARPWKALGKATSWGGRPLRHLHSVEKSEKMLAAAQGPGASCQLAQQVAELPQSDQQVVKLQQPDQQVVRLQQPYQQVVKLQQPDQQVVKLQGRILNI